MQFSSYQSYKLLEESIEKSNDSIVMEAPLQININGEPYTVVMRTPNDDYELVRGLLFAEDIYKHDEEFSFSIVKKTLSVPTVVNVNISQKKLGKGYLNKRTLLSVSSCGICGKKEIEDLKPKGEKLISNEVFSANDLQNMQEQMTERQNTFHKTGGCHAAAVFDEQHNLLTIKEDIGRHNAVDKTIGDLIQHRQLKKAKFLFVSGRVSYEIVSKAFIAKIGIIVAVSACSSLAIDFAKEFGICLIGFKRHQKLTIYSQPKYLKNLHHV